MSQPAFVFISYSTKDRAFVDRLKKDFESAGVDFWIDQHGLKVGTEDWEQAIRSAIREARAVILVASPDSRESRYVRDELLIAEMYERHVIAIWANGDEWANCVRMGLIGTQYADARGKRYKSALVELIGVLHQTELTPTPPIESTPAPPDFTPRNPYKGLRAFTGDDKDDYFGRESLITELVDALKANTDTSRFLAVVGPSGSGKSSVVMAGLLPALQTGALPGSDKWLYLDPVLPGAQPLESLAVVLSDALNTSITAVLDDLDHSARGLHLLARRLAKTRDSRVVLLVDQFEELFTQTADVDKRNHFIDLLVTAATEPGGQTVVLITLRADFYDRPMNYPELGKLLEQRTKSVLPMSIEDLRAVIEKPAALPDVQIEFEPGLVGDLLFEVRGQPGALPLMQFTLDQLVEKRQGRLLTNTAYRELGGVKGALAKHAEATYQNLPSDLHRDMARALFLRLIEPGETEQDTTRRRAVQNELITPNPAETEMLRQVALAFTDARLLTTNVSGESAYIEVSHEALIREWDRLAQWLIDSRRDIVFRIRLSENISEWKYHNTSSDYLYYGAALEQLTEWADRNQLNREENDFIDASRIASQRRKESDVMANLGEFFANYSHRMLNMLAFGPSIIEMIRHHLEKVEFLDKDLVFENLEILERNIHEVILLNRNYRNAVASGTVELGNYPTILSIEELIKNSISLIHIPNNIEFHTFSENSPVYVIAHTEEINDILMHLFFNAIEAMPNGGIVSIHIENKSLDTYISISDSGNGIEPHFLPYIFRLGFTTKKGRPGLGLWTSMRKARANRGDIFVESELGKGTTFVLRLPRSQKSASL